MRQRMGGLDRGDDPLEARAELEGVERLTVSDGDVLGAADIVEPRVLRPDARIVETSRDRVRVDDLAVVGLQEIGAVAVEYAGLAAVERGRVLAGLDAEPRRLDADHADRRIVEERVEQADRIGAAADAGDQRVRETPFGLV